MDQLRDLAADLRIEPSALLDIFLTAVLIYLVLRLIQGTRAVRLAIGAAIVYGVYADEADTVGATTLRPEHVTLHTDGTAEFRFLGKDSVLWHKEIELPPRVHQILAELIENARPKTER